MNTDNTSISGETIDYGPCAFMDAYDPAQVFCSIDEMGRYAYANQPRIALWNLTRLAECLLPLFSDDQEKAVAEAQDILAPSRRRSAPPIRPACARKIGLFTERDGDEALVAGPAGRHGEEPGRLHADLPPARRRRGARPAMPTSARCSCDPAAFDDWAARWRKRTRRGAASRSRAAGRDARRQPGLHPAQPPRRGCDPAAVNNDDYAPFEELVKVLAKPFEDQPDFAAYADPPQPDQRVLQTFCGT